MSPSIFDMFGDPALADEATDAAFDPAGFDKVLDDVIAGRPVAGRPTGYEPGGATPAPSSDGEASGAEGGALGEPTSQPPEAPAPLPPAAQTPPAAPAAPPSPQMSPADPFADLTELERLELLQTRQALNDPDRALAVRRALLGVPDAPAPAPTAAAAPPSEPTLPEDIDPGSFEAQLWQQNQDMRRELGEIRAGQQASQAQTEEQIVRTAAETSSRRFTERYAGRLTQQEIAAVCQHAGIQKLPEAFRPVSSSWEEAMDKALDYTLRSNDGLLAKVLGVDGQPAVAAPAPAAGQRTPEAVHRGRQLTALSSAASPSGEAAQRVPIETRPDGTGKMTERSRLALVQELVNGDGSLRSSE